MADTPELPKHEHELYLADWARVGGKLYEVWRCRSTLAVSEMVENPDHDPKSELARAVKSSGIDGLSYESIVPAELPGRTLDPGHVDHPHSVKLAFAEDGDGSVILDENEQPVIAEAAACDVEEHVLHDVARDKEFVKASEKSESQRDWYAALAPKVKEGS